MVASDYRILLVDDEPDIIEFLSYNLVRIGYTVLKAYSGEEAVKIAIRHNPHLIILDVMLPGIDGIEVCEQIRTHELLRDTIVAFLSARSEDYSQVAGFKAGGDDYITKPIKLKPFLSRVAALLKRYRKNSLPNNSDISGLQKVLSGNIEVNHDRHTVLVNGKEMLLPRKEFQLLNLMVSKPGKVFTRQVIFSQVWGDGVIVSARTIDVHIRKLREKIGSRDIVTLKGVGYKFED